MNSPELQKYDEFDASIGRELRSWAARQQPPAGGREALLEAAAPRTRRSIRANMLNRIQRWLLSPRATSGPDLPYVELSQWLYAQAMWHSLGNDRRAVRFVC